MSGHRPQAGTLAELLFDKSYGALSDLHAAILAAEAYKFIAAEQAAAAEREQS